MEHEAIPKGQQSEAFDLGPLRAVRQVKRPKAARKLLIAITTTLALVAAIALLGRSPFELWLGNRAYDKGDYQRAMKLLQPATENGNAEIQNRLGLMYEQGQGIPKDDGAAFKWYERAADQGNVLAQTRLASMCEVGRGIERDYVRALMWYVIAANGGSDEARKKEPLVAKNMSILQIARAQELANEWKPGSKSDR
jgi:hypothetical protein